MGGGVGGCQDDERVAFAERANWRDALVEDGKLLRADFAIANAIEHIEQRTFLLAEDLSQLEPHGAGSLGEGLHREEEGATVPAFEMISDLVLLHDGRELVQVSEHDEAHAAEWLARAPTVDAQRLVDGPHQVRAHHRHLVDDEQLQLAHDGAVATAPDVVGSNQPRRKAEEGMNCLAADIDSSEARRRDDYHRLSYHLGERAQ